MHTRPGPYDRKLENSRDRLVLVVGSETSRRVSQDLARLLDRLRAAPPGEPLDGSLNVDETDVLQIVTEHVRRSWIRDAEREPSEEEVHAVLVLCHASELRVEPGEADELAALDLLRQSVIEDPQQVEAAWSLILRHCASLSSTRSGLDSKTLRGALQSAGIPLRHIRSYTEDIATLRASTTRTCSRLGRHARLHDRRPLHIRRQFQEPLLASVEEGHLLLIGDPGVGKSGAVHQLSRALMERGRSLLLLAADQLAARSLGALRSELNLRHDVVEVLANWSGATPGFLVIDALDAARDDECVGMLRELLEAVIAEAPGWRVIASVRKFDLRHGDAWQRIFRGRPLATHRDLEFSSVRHLCVSPLSDSELAQLQETASEVHLAFERATPAMRGLLRNPFNLHIFSELMAAGATAQELEPLDTQRTLLDHFWLRRVIDSPGRGNDREVVLRTACEGMLKDRTLHVPLGRLAGPSCGAVVDDLLSTHVLMEVEAAPRTVDRRRICFSHHVLFDYATSVLLFESNVAGLPEAIKADPDLALFARPSLVLCFEALWYREPTRETFWALTHRLLEDDALPETVKMLPPSVAARRARNMSDLEPLLRDLRDAPAKATCAATLRHLVAELMVLAEGTDQPLSGPGAGPWCELVASFRTTPKEEVTYAIAPLLGKLCSEATSLGPIDLLRVNQAARGQLEIAWGVSRNRWLVSQGIENTCMTFAGEPAASARLLRRALVGPHLACFGHEELQRICLRLEHVNDPDFVVDLYAASFGHREESTESVPLSNSKIMPMTSNKRQDYDHALWQLQEFFPGFLDRHPAHATRALARAVAGCLALKREPSWYDPPAEGRPFELEGARGVLREDGSLSWDGPTWINDPHCQLLHAFQAALEQWPAERALELCGVVRVIAHENELAALWRRLFEAALAHPTTLGSRLRCLASQPAFLLCRDTSQSVIRLAGATLGSASLAERAKLEETLLELHAEAHSDHDGHEGRMRARVQRHLLSCGLQELASHGLVTDHARASWERIQPELPAGQLSGYDGGSEVQLHSERGDIQDLWLRAEGADPDDPETRAILDRRRSLSGLLDANPSQEWSALTVSSVQGAHDQLKESLSGATAIHPKVSRHAWDALAHAAGLLLRRSGTNLSRRDEVLDTLVEASRHPDPVLDPKAEAAYEESGSWSKPCVRLTASEQSIAVVGSGLAPNRALTAALQRLASDPVSKVRAPIFKHLSSLVDKQPALFAAILTRAIEGETSDYLLQCLLDGALETNLEDPAGPGRSALRVAHRRVRDDHRLRKVRRPLFRQIFRLHVWTGDPEGAELLEPLLADPAAFAVEAQQLAVLARRLICMGAEGGVEPEKDAARLRTINTLRRLGERVVLELDALQARYADAPSVEAIPPADLERFAGLSHIIYGLSTELDLGSKAGVSEAQRGRFYREAGDILATLGMHGHPAITRHIMEMYLRLVEFDPRGVFLDVYRLVRSGARHGYQQELIGMEQVVAFVGRYLADYRHLLRADTSCRDALRDMLDVFVRVGWPKARRLTHRLEEVFR